MDQPSDELIIVLHILDAINLHRPKNIPVLLSASLDKNALETGRRLPGIASTSFDSNLVWETDRRSVKRMKTENLPIKLECYSIDQQSSSEDQKRSLIGHLVLPLRSVPLLSPTKAGSVKPRWYRIVGISDPSWKSQKPEVQLMVVITGKEFLCPNEETKEEQDPDKASERSIVIFTNPEPSRLESREGLPIRLLEEQGLLQVGHFDQERDIFLVKIVLKYAKQLRKLIPDDEVALPAGFQLRYDLLGDSYPCTVERKPNGTFFIQEKIVINFRTSLHSLKRYFEETFLIRLEVLYEDKIVGRSCLRFGELLEEESLENFLTKHQENSNTMDVEKYYPIEQGSTKHEDNADASSERSSSLVPAIKCKFSLKYLTSDRKTLPEPVKAILRLQSDEDLPAPNLRLVDIPEASYVPSINQNQTSSLPPPPAAPPEKTDIESILHCEERDLRDIPRTFSYNLLLQSVRFNVRPSNGLWQLALFHPKADTPLTKVTLELTAIESETLEFPNLQLRLYFSSLPDLVLETITADSSKLTLHGPHGLFGFARVDNQSLVVGTKEKQCGVLILENQTGENIGMATVFCFLDEVGINYNSRDPVGGSEVPVAPKAQLDCQLSYRMLEEQKQWMLKQREMFLEDLKRKESAYLAKLCNEWKKRRAKENSELTEKLEHAAALTAALEESRKNVSLRGAIAVDADNVVKEMKAKLELSYQQQLAEIRAKAARLEDDLGHGVKLQNVRCQELDAKNNELAQENEQLRRDNERLGRDFENARRDAEAGRCLQQQFETLEQRLQESERSKLFYKQQWAKMIREVHKMKLENEEQLEEMLQGKEKKKRNFRWDDEREDCCQRASATNEQEEMDKIHRMIFEERKQQQQQCCAADHCC